MDEITACVIYWRLSTEDHYYLYTLHGDYYSNINQYTLNVGTNFCKSRLRQN